MLLYQSSYKCNKVNLKKIVNQRVQRCCPVPKENIKRLYPSPHKCQQILMVYFTYFLLHLYKVIPLIRKF